MTPWERFERRFLGRPPAAAVDVDGMLLSPAVAAFRSRVTVEPVTGSRLVNLRFTAYDPNVAAQAANALAQLYIKQALEFRFTTSSEATGWLGERIKEQQEKVDIAEKALQAYREKEGFLNFEERQGLVDQKLTTLSTAALNARTERIGKEALLNQMRNLGFEPARELPPGHRQPRDPGPQGGAVRPAEGAGQARGDPGRQASRHRPGAARRSGRPRRSCAARCATSCARSETEYRTAASQEASLNASLEVAKQEALEVNRKAIEFRRAEARGGDEPAVLQGASDSQQADWP